MNRTLSGACGGFSLIEMVVAITLLGILSAAAAVFMRGPIAAYFDAERRAELADAGSLAMAKLQQEISRAVPDSVRVTTVGANVFIEFLPVRSEGRYRVAGPGNALNFGVADTGFDVLGFAVQAQPGDWVVVNNYLATPGVNDVWAGNARAAYTGAAGSVSTISHASHVFALDAPDHRFQVASGPVTYVCIPSAAGGTLTRYGGYAIQPVQPANVAAAPLAAAQRDVLATRITACRAVQFRGNRRHAQVVALALSFGNAGDRLTLAETIRVEPLP